MNHGKSYKEQIAARTRENEGAFRNAGGEAPHSEALNPYETNLSFKIEKLDALADVTGPARIFGASDGVDEAFNSANNIKVTLLSSDHSKLKRKLLGSALKVRGLTLKATDTKQFSNKLIIKDDNIVGRRSEFDFFPITLENGYLTNPLFLESKNFQMLITEDSAVELEFTDGDYYIITFKIISAISLSNLLDNRPVIQEADPYASI